MLNVTKLYDVPGWAYYFISNEMKKYSKCQIFPQQWNKINYNLQDILIISGPNIDYNNVTLKVPQECRKRGIKVIGQYSSECDIIYEGIDLIVAISPSIYLYAKEKYKGKIPVIYLPEGIDCDYFKQVEFHRNRFVAGWAGGNIGKPFKRANLFEKLKYPVIIKSEHGKEYFREGRTQEAMLEFYKSIDCFINLSTTEACSRVILEAIASGLPVITTDTGSAQLQIVNKDYIAPVYPEEHVITEVNKKLDELSNSFELREMIGKVNRAWAETVWAWDKIMPIYDEIFYYLKEGNISKIEEIGESVIEPFKKYFQPCEKYTKQIENFAKLQVPTSHKNQSTCYDLNYTYIFEDLENYKEDWWVARENCLDTINRQHITYRQGKLYLGVKNKDDEKKLVAYLRKLGATGVSNNPLIFKKIEIHIMIEEVNKIKKMPCYGKNVNVPYPVIQYLINRFGYDWKSK